MKQAVRRKIHYIYKITRLDKSGKYYIGMHSTDNIDDGYFGSGSLLSKSIKKHGKDKHTKEILEFLPTREALKLREKEIVNEELLGDKRCMNLKLGGEGGWGPLQNEEYKLRGSKGGKSFHQRFKNDSNFAKRISVSRSETMTQTNRLRTFEARSRSATGVKLSSETKLKMSLAASKRQGEKNSQYGSCWVSDGIKPIKIRKEQLDEYLLIGYSLGRKRIPRL